MSDIVASLAAAVGLVLVAAILCGTALAAWRGWLDLKRLELAKGRLPSEAEPEADTGVLIEVAAVKERLRRLEAIASGVEL